MAKKRQISLAICLLILLVNSKADDVVEETLDFLSKGSESLKLTDKPESVLIIGNTGSGKSTLVHYAAVDPSKVESVETDDPDAVDFIVVDHLDADSSNTSTTVSRTIVPELVSDEGGNPWYDCPGFSDTRNSSVEIATTYFVKMVVDKAKFLKIVFVVNYASVTPGYDRIDFDTLVNHGVAFIKDIDRYRDSIALIVSKTPSVRVRGRKVFDVPEESAINSAAGFIAGYRQVLTEKPDNELKIKLVDSFLSKSKEGAYNRIGIFFRPNDVGTFDKIPKMVESRKTILRVIHTNIGYTETQPNDFGYSLSERAELDIQVMSNHLHRNIKTTMKQMDDVMVAEMRVNGDNFDDLHDRQAYYSRAFTGFSEVESKAKHLTPKKLLWFARQYCSSLNISVNNDFFTNLVRQQKNLNVLTLISTNAIELPTEEWLFSLRNTKKRATDESNWYSFISYLYDFFSSFEAQQNKGAYNVRDVNDWGKKNRPQGLYIHANNFDDFVQKHSGYSQLIKGIDRTPERFRDINDIIRTTLQIPIEIDCRGDAMVVKGPFVILTAINVSECSSYSRIHVIATNKIFFDYTRKFHNLTEFIVIANRWIVNQNLTVDLSGADATALHPKNVKGTYERAAGVAGKPGLPGRNGASFFGYAKEIVNGEGLVLNLSGGKGGRGQDGSSAYPEQPFFDIRPTDKYDQLFGYEPLTRNNYLYRKIYGPKLGDMNYNLRLLMACRKENGNKLDAFYTLFARQCCLKDGLAGTG